MALLIGLLLLPGPVAGALQPADEPDPLGFGPLQMRTQSPFHTLRTGLLPYMPVALQAGEWEAATTLTWTNRWAFKEGRYLIDMEVARGALLLRYGATDRLSLQVEAPVLWRGGGYMDGLIENFHDLFGLDQADRDLFPRYQLRMEITNKEGELHTLSKSDARIGMADIVVSAQHNVFPEERGSAALAWGLSLKLPTGSKRGVRGTPGVDPGLYVSGSVRLGRGWTLHAAGAYTYHGTERLFGLRMRPYAVAGLAAVEWRAHDGFSVVLQLLVHTGAAKSFFELSDPTTELTLGFKWRASSGTIVELGVVENLFKFDNSPDFGVHLGLTFRGGGPTRP